MQCWMVAVKLLDLQTLLPDEKLIADAAEEVINTHAGEDAKPLRRKALECFAGRHMRSAMYLIQWLVKNPTDTACNNGSFSEQMVHALFIRLHQLELKEVMQHIVAGLNQSSSYKMPEMIANCVGPSGDVPLPYVWFTGNVILRNLLSSVAFGQTTKLLEVVCRSLDLFKAEQCANVLPKTHRMQARLPKVNLKFPRYMTLCEDVDAFKQDVTGTKVAYLPEPGKYYHPKTIDHPLVDRAALAYDEKEGKELLILYRDKTGREVASKAVAEGTASLVAAVKVLKEEYTKRRLACPVFVCLLTVPSTLSDHSVCLKAFRRADAFHCLIGHNDIGDVFTPTLAPVVEYLMVHRHSEA